MFNRNHLHGWDSYGNRVVDRPTQEHELPNVLGQEVAERLLQTEPNSFGQRELRGQDLDIGSRGMETYYDHIIPKQLLALAKEHNPDAAITPHVSKDKKVAGHMSLAITPKMRESILKNGFKAFKKGGYVENNNDMVSKALKISKGLKNVI